MISRRSILTLPALMVLAGCSGEGNRAIEGRKLLLSLKTLDNPFFTEIRRGVESSIGAENMIVRAGRNESDVTGQRELLEGFATNRIDELSGLIITPCSSGPELVGALASYSAAGIPVVLVDTGIPRQLFEAQGAAYTAFIASSNQRGGEIAAGLINRMSPTGRLLLLNGVDGSDSASQRRQGFMSALEGRQVLERTANWRRQEAREIVAGLIGNNHSTTGIFAANDEMALGALAAYEDARQPPPPIVGFDATDEAVRAVRAGRLTATVAQDPFAMGTAAAAAATAAVKTRFADRLLDVKLVQR